ncbi:acVLRF1 family peptidyl-tRNA hydrolase [Arthrobacter sp. H20]|uniref:acVLRF1 family peptidyl-tRNA hydrolase n=1 Tax=Arthrobacter sp. H20 TaxID=1267981 RepID=UPI00047AEE40|nr:acVLRF1 family peptidyl-tRNA hydrolase [Arthrobacter sp. H20]
MGSPRHVLVSPERLPGWVERFSAGNGGLASTIGHDAEVRSDGGLMLRGANGCVAELYPPWESPSPVAPDGWAVQDLVSTATSELLVGLLLVRRGGYAVGVADNGKLVASKTGTKYVQSRTAAGGWSQQRFARRRANQAAGLAEAAAAHAARLFGEHPPACLQLGGDRPLAAETLANPALRGYQALPKLKFLVVPDPRLDILKQAAIDSRSIRITIIAP